MSAISILTTPPAGNDVILGRTKSLKGGQICKVYEEYFSTGDDYWKTKARKHERRPSEMFKKYITSDKHENALVAR